MAAYKFNEQAKKQAIRAYAATANRTAACDAAGISLTCLEDHLKHDKEFEAKFKHAKGQYIEGLEKEALRRAVEGWDEDRMGAGGVLYGVKKFSDALLLHLLKKKAPEEHGDSMKIDQTTVVSGSLGLEQLSRESRDQLRQILERETDVEEESEDQ